MCLDNKNKIEGIQSLRLLAFIGIFLAHACEINLGAWGVSIFIIISAFLLTYKYYDDELDVKLCSLFCFAWKHVKRLYLLHIVMMVSMLAFPLWAVISGLDCERQFVVISVLLNIFLLQTWVPIYAYNMSLNAVSWYLATVAFLYFIFPLTLKLVKRLKSKYYVWIIVLIILIMSLTGYCAEKQGISLDWYTYTFPLYRLGDFLVGVLFCSIYLNKGKHFEGVHFFTIVELMTITISVLQYYFYVYVPRYISRTVIYIPTSILLVWLFVEQKGIITEKITTKKTVLLAEYTPYAFLIHGVLIRYYDSIFDQSSKVVKMFVCIILTAILSYFWKKLITKFTNRKRCINLNDKNV